ncbi:MAG: DUF5979 domain-containing protein [Alphaproteobacteria bacterium]
MNALTYPSNTREVYVALALPITAPSKVLGVHIYSAASGSTYDPTISGPIGSVKGRLESRCSGASCTSQQQLQLFGPALRQGGNHYVSGASNGYPVGTYSGPSGTLKVDSSRWAANQFCLVSNATIAGNNNIVCDASQHPDFASSGAPIQCGFFTYSDASIAPTPIPSGSIINSTDGRTYYSVRTSYDNWSCEFIPPTGSLAVTKSILSDPVGIAGVSSFPINVTCTDPSGSQSTYAINVNGNTTSAPIDDLVPGSQCQIAETLPAPFLDNSAVKKTCVWATPTYSNQNVAIEVGLNTVTVTNSYSCSYLRTPAWLRKDVSPDPLGIGSSQSFSISATCQAAVPFTRNVQGNNSALIGYMAVADTCQFTETLPGPFNHSGQTCTWQAPTFSPAPFTITAGGSNIATVTNTYTCVPQTGTLSIFKLILDPAGSPLVIAGPWGPNAPTFNISANCGGQGPGGVSLAPPILVGSIPSLTYGTACTITEPTLPAPFTDSAGNICTWQQQAPLNQTIPINGPAQAVTVTNTFTRTARAASTGSDDPHAQIALASAGRDGARRCHLQRHGDMRRILADGGGAHRRQCVDAAVHRRLDLHDPGNAAGAMPVGNDHLPVQRGRRHGSGLCRPNLHFHAAPRYERAGQHRGRHREHIAGGVPLGVGKPPGGVGSSRVYLPAGGGPSVRWLAVGVMLMRGSSIHRGQR